MLDLKNPNSYFDSEDNNSFIDNPIPLNRIQKIDCLNNRLYRIIQYSHPLRVSQCLDKNYRDIIKDNPDPDYTDNPDYPLFVECYQILNELKRIDWLEYKKTKSVILKYWNNIEYPSYKTYKSKGKGYTQDYKKMFTQCVRKHKPYNRLIPNPDPDISILSRYFPTVENKKIAFLTDRDNRIIKQTVNKPIKNDIVDISDLVRVKKDRKYFDLNRDLEIIQERFLKWVKTDEAIIIERREYPIESYGKAKIKTLLLKASKRGNDIYQKRVQTTMKKLFEDIEKITDIKECRNHELVKSNILYITLTCDTKKGSINDMWDRISKDWNKFQSSIKQKFGKISLLRAFESFESGYPHIHVFMVFKDTKFLLHQYSNNGYMTWRVTDKIRKIFQSYWHSFIDIQGITIQKIKSGIYDTLWYIMKNNNESNDPDLWEKKHLLTMAITWFKGKRAFSISRDLTDLINAICIIQIKPTVQIDLHGQRFVVEYRLIGILTYSEIGINPNIWYKEFDNPDWLNAVRQIHNSKTFKSLTALENMFKC